ncbi:YfhO family protein [Facklamia lactis]|uniref:YfhO family protein n=1 Tax=Facklamia lactis TaxID=2749967 RepID=UPI0018CF4086|nr:YfhO family protein [Facklamia lactis]MBG9980072.1 YfhO family protein [Facklamia lactis]
MLSNVKSVKYILNATLSLTIMIILAIIFKFIPFGGPEDRTMLTIDLGQQYIDFFSTFRKTLLSDPRQLLYSFEKGIGGEMIGLWAYYLISPFNLIFLFFNENNLDLGVTFLTIAKILAASTTFFYFNQKKYQSNPYIAMAFAQCYAFMSYTITFQLNIMWFDALILLPIVALGLDYIIKGRKPWLYVISLALLIMFHYYIGMMVCFFLALYAAYLIIENQDQFVFKKFIIQYFIFIKYSIFAVLIAGIVLVPTVDSMTASKGAQLDPETELIFEFVQEHHFVDVWSKMFMGGFVYDEMSSGSPNIYAGMLTWLLVFFYFFNRNIKLSEKITSLIIIIIFYFSFSIELLDKLWHGGQFPIWYDFRFSFTFSFFMLTLAIKAFDRTTKTIPIYQIVIVLISMAVITFGYFKYTNYSYHTPEKLFMSLAFFVILLVIMQLTMLPEHIKSSLLLLVTCFELTTNAVLILSEIDNYVQPSKFNDYISTLSKAVDPLKHDDSSFYRIHKTFQRTKNEAMYNHYHGLDHFGSTIEVRTTQLYGFLGLPNTSNAVNYTNGTLFTDDLFDIRYLLDISSNTRIYTKDDGYVLYRRASDFDINAYPILDKENRYVTHENTERLGFAVEVSPEIVNAKFEDFLPIDNQEMLLQLIDYEGNGETYFKKKAFNEVVYNNLEVADKGDGDFYTYRATSKDQKGSFTLYFDTESENPYYFTLPSQFSNSNVSIQLNNDKYSFYTPAEGRQITNASFNHIQSDQNIRVNLKKDSLKSNLISLYEFDLKRYEEMINSKQNHLFDVISFKQNEIQGTIDIQQKEGYLLIPLPYDKHWKITVNNKKIKPIPVLSDTMMALPLTKGPHNISMTYFPNTIWYGLVSTLIGILLVLLDQKFLFRETTYSIKS